jgi:hypothetical protein
MDSLVKNRVNSIKVGARDKREDKTTVSTLVKALRAGNTKKDACSIASISEQTFYRWLREGENASEGSLPWQFCESIKKAIAEARARNVVIIQKHAANNWTAAAWWLERSDPESWGKRDRVEMTGADGGAMEMRMLNENEVSDEELADIMTKFSQAKKQQEA